MQLILPIFPAGTELLNAQLGVFTKDGLVTYVHCGVPIFSHAKDDHKGFRYITSKFIRQGLCRMTEVSDIFHVSYDSVKRYVRKLDDEGERGFFGPDNRRGSCYKLLPAVIARMQKYIDAGKSNSEIARLEDVTEGAVRYAMKKGSLKKTSDISRQG